MPKHSELIELQVSAEEALATCRAALDASGWEITDESPGRLTAREEAWRLDCHTSPSQIEVSTLDTGAVTTTLSVRASAPGIGPIPGPGRLRRQLAALRLRMAEATARRIA